MKTFGSLREWWLYTKSATGKTAVGIFSVVVSIFMGVASVLLALWRFMARKVGRYPNIALGAFLVAVILAWLLTFVSMRARAVGAECQRDALAYQFTAFKECHGYE